MTLPCFACICLHVSLTVSVVVVKEHNLDGGAAVLKIPERVHA